MTRHYIEALVAGMHAGFFYRTKPEQFAVIVPFIATGLARNERCLYIADENSVRRILDVLQEAGIDVDAQQKRGALSVLTKQETYLRYGMFEPDRMIKDLAGEVRRSIACGFTAFRATGEMTWALSHASSLAQLREYEIKLDATFPKQFVGLCQFNETAFSPQTISDAIRSHPYVVGRGRSVKNVYYVAQQDLASTARPLVNVDQVVAAAE